MKYVSIQQASKILREGRLVCLQQGDRFSILCDGMNRQAVEGLIGHKLINCNLDVMVWVDNDAKINKYIEEVPELAWDLFDSSEGNLVLRLPGGRNIDSQALGKDGSLALRRVINQNEVKLCRSASFPILCGTNSLIQSPDSDLNESLSQIEYVLTLSPNSVGANSRPYSIVYLGQDNAIQILRE